jgi:hypothetical protein
MRDDTQAVHREQYRADGAAEREQLAVEEN